MASNKNDIHVQFSKLTQSEIDQFCADYAVDPTLETQVPGDRTANECPAGFLVFYTRIVDQPNLRYPFTNFFLEVLKYYRLSLGQLGPVGVPRIMHFEILCQALTYEPSLLMFRLFSGLPGTATGTPSRRLNVRHPSFLTPLVILILGRTNSFLFLSDCFLLLLFLENFLRF
ncbi:hypothetical protein HanRHA438_Chr15g0693911 [Helianthus annuus]|nr:hypothetical protein HanIR_Chr15g0740501 [Helianthus annuus]KAJ0843676.1 hypothetical protein HanRHA438_Chr15g0693911 [Helianthus annuus]